MSDRVKYFKGDVLDSGERYIAHGCNCFCTMGSGVAKAIKERHPEVYERDRKTGCGDREKLGTADVVYLTPDPDHENRLIFNLYTQYEYGGERPLNYEALYTSLSAAAKMVRGRWPRRLAIPRIGCGLGGGDWRIVSAMLEVIGDEHDIQFHVYDLE